MADCCGDESCAPDQLHDRQGAALRIVLALNAVMLVVELAAGAFICAPFLLSAWDAARAELHAAHFPLRTIQ